MNPAFCSPVARPALERSRVLARTWRSATTDTAHLLVALSELDRVRTFLTLIESWATVLDDPGLALLDTVPTTHHANVRWSDAAERVFQLAGELSADLQDEWIEPEVLLVAMATSGTPAGALLRELLPEQDVLITRLHALRLHELPAVARAPQPDALPDPQPEPCFVPRGGPASALTLEIPEVAAILGRLHTDPGDTLERLRSVWVQCPDPALGVLIEQLGAKLARAVPLDETRPADEVWRARLILEQPADTGVLARAAVIGSDVAGRLHDLLLLRPDPRTTAPLLAWARDHWYTGLTHGERTIWAVLLRVLAHHRDPQAAVGFGRLADEATSVDLVGTLAALPAPGRLDRNALFALRQAIDTFVAGPAVSPDLVHLPRSRALGAVRQATWTGDPDAVEVWHDQLLESGDPLAAWVTLQLLESRRGLTDAERDTMDALAWTHRLQLLGPLHALIDRTWFHRGVLVGATVSPTSDHEGLQHPMWSSVREIYTTIAHLQHPVLDRVQRVGLRLVPFRLGTGLLAGRLGPPGFKVHNELPCTWEVLEALADRRPAALQAVCVGLPNRLLAPEDLRALGELVVPELHLVDSRLEHAPSPRHRLGALVDHPILRDAQTLVLDGFVAPEPLVDWALLRRPGQTLIYVGAEITVLQQGEAGMRATICTHRTLGRCGSALARLGDPYAYEHVLVRCTEGTHARDDPDALRDAAEPFDQLDVHALPEEIGSEGLDAYPVVRF